MYLNAIYSKLPIYILVNYPHSKVLLMLLCVDPFSTKAATILDLLDLSIEFPIKIKLSIFNFSRNDFVFKLTVKL